MGQTLAGTPSESYPIPPGIAFAGLAGGPPPGRPTPAALLEAGPVLDPAFETKQVSPVDMIAAPAAAYRPPGYGPAAVVNSLSGFGETAMYAESAYQGFSPSFNSGMVRVLSPKGETLGHAPYSLDQRGKVVVHPDFGELQDREGRRASDTGPREGQQSSVQSFLPRAAEFLRNFRDYVPGINRFQWTR